ncbi:hypothetical protein PIB30_068671 [Stylosanthes scabra]|uniref:Uncharacterized protein n=1 Tax=Stylosanthes scabra TaxID=79078 RepID=A0ABU6URM2_9FABA|nr:hypothetical protein [Stylosanthes scabra]
MLLSTSLFGDKTAARVHVRWLPFVEHIDDLGQAEYFDGFRPLDFTGRVRHLRVAIGLQVSPYVRLEGAASAYHRRQLDLMPFREFVCLPYRTDAVEAVLDRSILQDDHRALWTSIVPLIYFGTIEWHQVDQEVPCPGWAYHHLPADEIPVNAIQRQSAPHLERPVVPNVPDNRRLGRRMMVGTRTTTRDWQWLDEMMGDDAPGAGNATDSKN